VVGESSAAGELSEGELVEGGDCVWARAICPADNADKSNTSRTVAFIEPINSATSPVFDFLAPEHAHRVKRQRLRFQQKPGASARQQASQLPACVISSSLFIWSSGRVGSKIPQHGVSVLRGKTLFGVLLVVASLLPSCSQVVNNPSPSIKSLSPPSANAGDPAFTLTVNGSGFAPQSTVVWNGLAFPTIFLSGSQLTATIAFTFIANPGTVPVVVSTPSPGGGTSNSVNFVINPVTSPIPQITSLSPNAALAGGNDFTLTVTGTGFVSRSVVIVNGANQSTTFTNSTSLQVTITAAEITSVGSLQVAVLNPPPGGGASNPVTLAVTNPAPALTSLSPTTGTVGAGSLTLTVNGTGFDSLSVVRLNGQGRATSFVNSTQVTAILTMADLAEAQTAQIQVVNPAPGGGASNILGFSILPGSAGAGLPELVDIANNGVQANNGVGDPAVSGPAMDSTGRFTAFASISSNLVPNDTNSVADIFLRDSCVGAPQTTAGIIAGSGPVDGQTTLAATVSASAATLVSISITPANPSVQPKASEQFTATGTFSDGSTQNLTTTVTWSSSNTAAATISNSVGSQGLATTVAQGTSTITAASGSVMGQTTLTVSTSAATLSSISVTPANPSDPLGPTQQFTATGTFSDGSTQNLTTSVTWSSSNTAVATISNTSGTQGLVTTVAQGTTTIIATSGSVSGQTTLTVTGCAPQTTLVSLASSGAPSNGASSEPSMDGSGRFVAFTSTATNLVAGITFTGSRQVFLSGTCAGTTSTCTSSNQLVSVSVDGVSPALSDSFQPAISPDGRFVAFTSAASNLVTGVLPSSAQIFLRDTCNGQPSTCTPSTTLITVPNDGSSAANGASSQPAVANNGAFVSFSSRAMDLVSGVTSGTQQIFLRATCKGGASGCTPSTTLITVPNDGSSAANGASLQSSLSSDGRFIAFASTATNLVSGVTSGVQQIFLRDSCTGATGCTASTTLVSTPDGTTPGGDKSEQPRVSANGQIVAFASLATNLVASDSNAVEDVFARNTCAGAASGCTKGTVRVSVSAASSPQQGNAASLSPAISGNGHFVTFISFANNLVANDINGADDVFLAITTF
jgi:hypothetical protein